MKKKILIAGVLAAILLIIYTAAWVNVRDDIYGEYIDKMEHLGECTYACTDDEGYSYNVKLPEWPGFTGNLCISSPEGNISLFIWPDISGNDEYGIQIMDETDDEITMESSIVTDEKGNPKKSISSEEEKCLMNNEEIIYKLFLKAKKSWNA